jgi:hypothetical protein
MLPDRRSSVLGEVSVLEEITESFFNRPAATIFVVSISPYALAFPLVTQSTEAV